MKLLNNIYNTCVCRGKMQTLIILEQRMVPGWQLQRNCCLYRSSDLKGLCLHLKDLKRNKKGRNKFPGFSISCFSFYSRMKENGVLIK